MSIGIFRFADAQSEGDEFMSALRRDMAKMAEPGALDAFWKQREVAEECYRRDYHGVMPEGLYVAKVPFMHDPSGKTSYVKHRLWSLVNVMENGETTAISDPYHSGAIGPVDKVFGLSRAMLSDTEVFGTAKDAVEQYKLFRQAYSDLPHDDNPAHEVRLMLSVQHAVLPGDSLGVRRAIRKAEEIRARIRRLTWLDESLFE